MKTIQQFLTLGLALGAASFAKAQTVNPSPAPTIITTAPYTISTSGYYQLGANINVNNTSGDIITIAVANVTLDFAGHYISGPVGMETSSTLTGVSCASHANIIIQNGTVSHCYEGILFSSTDGGTSSYNELVQNMLVTNTAHIGVNYLGVLNSRAINNVITNIGGAVPTNGTGNYGFFLQGTVGNITLENNVISGITAPTNNTNAAYGIFVNNSAAAILARNRIFKSNYGIVFATTNAASKIQDNLTSGVTTPFSGGTDAGGNN